MSTSNTTMAASTGSIVQTVTETDAEIEELKSKYAGNIKVIRDMGDFKFMIDVKTVKVTLKFQIDGKQVLFLFLFLILII